jgi:16S rRNA processing protein RimM
MTTESCYKIGFIMRPHGLKGEVTIALDAAIAEELAGTEIIFVEVSERLTPFFVETLSLRGRKAFLKFEEVNTREQAEDLSGSSLFLAKSSRPRADSGEFYDDEVIGFQVLDTALGHLGKIQAIVQAGPNKLLSIDNGGKEVLVPLNSPFIRRVNKGSKEITVTLPEGFLNI